MTREIAATDRRQTVPERVDNRILPPPERAQSDAAWYRAIIWIRPSETQTTSATIMLNYSRAACG
jgi:hypothetical protein